MKNTLAAILACLAIGLLAGSGGCATPATDVTGAEFIRAVESRAANEQFALSRDEKAGYCYADRYVMRSTQSVYRFDGRLRTPAGNITRERYQALLHKLAMENGIWHFDAARGRH